MNNPPNFTVANLFPVGADEALAVSSTAVSVVGTAWASTATHALLTNGANPVRATFDGSGTPTASEGHYLAAGWSAVVPVAVAKQAKFIRVSGDSDLHATPLRP
jgi:hypothetical protein